MCCIQYKITFLAIYISSRIKGVFISKKWFETSVLVYTISEPPLLTYILFSWGLIPALPSYLCWRYIQFKSTFLTFLYIAEDQRGVHIQKNMYLYLSNKVSRLILYVCSLVLKNKENV